MVLLQPLTPNEKKVLSYILSYMESSDGICPSFLEIKDHFQFASFNSVTRYIEQLERKGYVTKPPGNQKRALIVRHTPEDIERPWRKDTAATSLREVDSQRNTGLLSLPLLGKVAAGVPIESLEHDEFIDIPPSLIGGESHRTFALKVKGRSMIGDGIFDGDIILVQQQRHAHNGEIVVAMTENEATVKRYFLHKNPTRIELRPSNPDMQSLWYNKASQVEILGTVIGLIRKMRA